MKLVEDLELINKNKYRHSQSADDPPESRILLAFKKSIFDGTLFFFFLCQLTKKKMVLTQRALEKRAAINQLITNKRPM